MVRRRPRAYTEWKTLRRWGKLPPWEPLRAGYVLREARERAGLSQAELARHLGCSQQAISQAERAGSNPTAAFVEAWARALGGRAEVRIALPGEPCGKIAAHDTTR
jgi:transcriptional regulator with XRE-family HTH domain